MTKFRILMKEAGMAKNGLAPKIEDCSVPMRVAFKRLSDAGYTAAVCSEYHLKIDDLNFWPGTGTIGRDGKPKYRQKGVDAFIDILIAEYQLEVLSPKASAPISTGSSLDEPVSAPPSNFDTFARVPKQDVPPIGRKWSPRLEADQEDESSPRGAGPFHNLDLFR